MSRWQRTRGLKLIAAGSRADLSVVAWGQHAYRGHTDPAPAVVALEVDVLGSRLHCRLDLDPDEARGLAAILHELAEAAESAPLGHDDPPPEPR